jgi:hypothetical protein
MGQRRLEAREGLFVESIDLEQLTILVELLSCVATTLSSAGSDSAIRYCRGHDCTLMSRHSKSVRPDGPRAYVPCPSFPTVSEAVIFLDQFVARPRPRHGRDKASEPQQTGRRLASPLRRRWSPLRSLPRSDTRIPRRHVPRFALLPSAPHAPDGNNCYGPTGKSCISKGKMPEDAPPVSAAPYTDIAR